MRILLVEDDADTREAVGHLLQQAGAHVYPVTTSAAALQEFQSRGCDIVITDYSLGSSGNGYHLLRLIRAQPVDAHVPVIGYSAYGNRVAPEERAAFTVYLTKPEVLADLVDTVRRTLRP